MVIVVVAPAAPGVTTAGENDTVAPAGKPLALSVTGWVNVPSLDVTSTAKLVLAPAVTVAVPGAAVNPKSLGAAAPVPDSALVCVPTESTTVSVAEAAPGAVGVNVTAMVHEAPAASEAAQVFAPIWKLAALPPANDIEVIGSGALPALVSVNVCDVLVAPTVTVAKSAVAATNAACGAAATAPVQLSATVCCGWGDG
jgi:hypothetical protein